MALVARENEQSTDGSETYKVCALVAEYSPPDPMAAAAVIWTAHPQSMEVMPGSHEVG